MSVPEPVPARPDRRVRRTREALRDALLALLVERGWDDIDVQALCARADIGRSTFYLHFPNKEALLRGSLADLREALRARASGPQPGTAGAAVPLAFLGGLIAHVHEQQQVFRALLGRRSGQIVQERFREMLVELVEQDLDLSPDADWPARAGAHCLAGALFQLLVWWLGSVPGRSPQEVEALFRRFSAGAGGAHPGNARGHG
ncbi:TetR/AcrR family transcriptional regulator [uncultured Sphaerotilus sp.]|uniref:TetR/AcrR family transcriptional regulator n=1 Tax=uncultured Sphaerotilus sp. TaxID=474984 RepID=UPI0030CA2CDC